MMVMKWEKVGFIGEGGDSYNDGGRGEKRYFIISINMIRLKQE